MNSLYQALGPWAEADPIPLTGISERLTDLENRKIGMYCCSKQAARPIMEAFEKKFKERYPSCETSWFILREVQGDMSKFEEWVRGVDAVVGAVGD
ncbi:MAG: hypothetical protein JXA46_18085 [Dehalococcoidales bacterium]|nr:hypothetical protein [Dehalococcoidales bacterium]